VKTSEQQSPAGAAGAAKDPSWDPAHAANIEPTVARGGNVVAVMPPAPIYLQPAAAALSHLAEETGLQVIVLASDAMLDSIGQALARAWRDTDGTILTAREAGRAVNLLRLKRVTALVTSPDTALALLARSSLPLSSAPAVLLAWPETWDDDTALAGIMQDLPAEAQRILYTAEPRRAEKLGERYLRKALVLGVPPLGMSSRIKLPITVASVSGTGIGTAVRQVIDLLEPISVSVWTAASETESIVTDALAKTPFEVQVTRGDIAPAKMIVAADLPRPEDLVRLNSATDRLIVVSQVWEIPYLAGHASALETLLLPGSVDVVDRTLAKQRSRIEGMIGTGGSDLDRAVNALGPVFQRHDPAMVAAALYRLWTTESSPEPEPEPAPKPALSPPPGKAKPAGQGRSTKVFVTAGKKDGATPADFVAMLTRDLKVPPEHIGKIDLHETFSLIELPADQAEAVAESLTGRTIRRRKIIARLERQR
jgi:hypothetical protein